MKFRQIPGSHVTISEVGFSVRALTAFRERLVDEKEALHLMRYAVDRGINFFEAADSSENGYGETLMGNALSEERDRVFIATKFGYDFYRRNGRKEQAEVTQDFSPEYVRFACEESLKRLRTDHIDLYQVYHPDLTAIETDALYGALERLRRQGKIITWGGALGHSAEAAEEGRELIRRRKVPCLQMVYNLLEQDLARELFEEGHSAGTQFLVRLPHASGLLVGKDTQDFYENDDYDRPRSQEWFMGGLKKVKHLQFLTREGERTLGQAALKFILAEPAVICTLLNIYTEDQINEFSRVSECPNLTDEEMRFTRELYSRQFHARSETPESFS